MSGVVFGAVRHLDAARGTDPSAAAAHSQLQPIALAPRTEYVLSASGCAAATTALVGSRASSQTNEEAGRPGLFAQEKYGGVNGLFFGGGAGQLGIQLVGVLAVFGWVFVTSLILFIIIKRTVGLRVTREDELRGLDIGEHGTEAYNDFQVFTSK